MAKLISPLFSTPSTVPLSWKTSGACHPASVKPFNPYLLHCAWISGFLITGRGPLSNSAAWFHLFFPFLASWPGELWMKIKKKKKRICIFIVHLHCISLCSLLEIQVGTSINSFPRLWRQQKSHMCLLMLTCFISDASLSTAIHSLL